MEGGEVTHYLQLERWTRRKYDNQMHLHIEALMDQGIIPFSYDADFIFVNSFVGSSFLSQHGRIRFEQTPRQSLTPDAVPGFGWVEFRKWDGRACTAYGMDHELAHVCANLPFHGSFRENSLLVHFDGGASLGNFSAYLYSHGKLEVLACHWELAQLSKLFNDNALSFALLNHGPGEHCAVPGKLMGFATIGAPTHEISAWLRANHWFKDIWADQRPFYQAAKTDFGWTGTLGDTRDAFLQDLAACIQQEFQDAWLAYLEQLQHAVQADFLYFSGGCALNIVANTQIVDSGLFQDVYIPPCPGDSGLSIGAAALLEWQKHGNVKLHGPYLNNAGLADHPYSWDGALVKRTGEALAQGHIIGVCNGPGEAGPRALGNRSILARPDSPALAQKVSMGCKGREWYRPIAPVMLEKHAKRLTGKSAIHHLSRLMLLDFDIPAANRAAIAGVVHANGTSRIQTLFSRADNPFLWDVLMYLDEHHGIPALINTSFNGRGEPIVHTAAQAKDSAMQMGLDAVVLNGTFHSFAHTLVP
ncbi:MAG: carbamoyltransferase C-terminal domain-containing protein [Bacteroidia bacterium]|nr:carbamoyltransferase C-terminal domain-containing protein [Bacteroidia bacterium]